MNIFEKINVLQKVAKIILLKRKFPLALTWNITYRCNLQCIYCGSWQNKSEELDTKDIFAIIEEFSNLGGKFIKFSGGEPLLREDLSEIIDFCKKKNLFVLLNSNGVLIKKDFKKIKDADEIQLSLDGPEEIHDFIRGKGIYEKVIEAIDACKTNNISTNLTTVLSKYNIDISSISHIFDITKKYNIAVQFQPADQMFSVYSNKNIRLLYSPSENDFRKIISFLKKEKKKGNRYIGNSYSALKHLYYWPTAKKVECFLFLFHCHLEPDGKMSFCSEFENYRRYLVPIKGNFRKAFNNLSLPHPCSECWCADIEYNLCGELKLNSLIEMWKRFSRL